MHSEQSQRTVSLEERADTLQTASLTVLDWNNCNKAVSYSVVILKPIATDFLLLGHMKIGLYNY